MKNLLEKLKKKSKLLYANIFRPVRRKFLSQFYDVPVCVFTGTKSCPEGGLFRVVDCNANDGMLYLVPLIQSEGAFNSSAWVYSYDCMVITDNKTKVLRATILTFSAKIFGRI